MPLHRRSAALLLGLAVGAARAAEPSYGPELEGFDYPHPVQQFRFTSQGVALHMAYMDVKPAKPNGRTVVLLHGKNFCAATWQSSIDALSKAGYRVVAPDQIGFCKSSKPEHYQYSFQQLAANTHALLESIGVKQATVVGHSTGGMALGVPSLGVDKWYERELGQNADKIRAYEKSTYYVNQWKPEYEPWVQMLAGLYRGPGQKVVAWNSALLYDMIYTQPVVYEFPLLKMPVLLLIGTRDNTAIGKDAAPAELRPKLGNYAELGKRAAKAIPHATLVEFDNMGHAPQMQDPAAFHAALLKGLAGR
jgi:pimeloyl-ACP methyl ester carboxylesterase